MLHHLWWQKRHIFPLTPGGITCTHIIHTSTSPPHNQRRPEAHLIQRAAQGVPVLLQPHRLPLRVPLLRLQHGHGPLQRPQPLLPRRALRLGGLGAALGLRQAGGALAQGLPGVGSTDGWGGVIGSDGVFGLWFRK